MLEGNHRGGEEGVNYLQWANQQCPWKDLPSEPVASLILGAWHIRNRQKDQNRQENTPFSFLKSLDCSLGFWESDDGGVEVTRGSPGHSFP